MDDPLTTAMLAEPMALGGARPGARVLVATPQGSRWDGSTGTIRRVYEGAAFVSIDGEMNPPMPFALGELHPLSSLNRPSR